MKIDISELPTYEDDGRLYLKEEHNQAEGLLWKAYLASKQDSECVFHNDIIDTTWEFTDLAYLYSIKMPKPEPVYEDGEWVMIKTEEQLKEVAVKTLNGDYYSKKSHYMFINRMLNGETAIAGKAVKLTGSESLRAGRWRIEPWMISHKLPCRPSWIEDGYYYWDGADPEYEKKKGDEREITTRIGTPDEVWQGLGSGLKVKNHKDFTYRRKIVKRKTWRPYESIDEVDLGAYYKMKFGTEWLTRSGVDLATGEIKLGDLWVHYTDLFDSWRTSKDPRTEPITPCGVEVEG